MAASDSSDSEHHRGATPARKAFGDGSARDPLASAVHVVGPPAISAAQAGAGDDWWFALRAAAASMSIEQRAGVDVVFIDANDPRRSVHRQQRQRAEATARLGFRVSRHAARRVFGSAGLIEHLARLGATTITAWGYRAASRVTTMLRVNAEHVVVALSDATSNPAELATLTSSLACERMTHVATSRALTRWLNERSPHGVNWLAWDGDVSPRLPGDRDGGEAIDAPHVPPRLVLAPRSPAMATHQALWAFALVRARWPHLRVAFADDGVPGDRLREFAGLMYCRRIFEPMPLTKLADSLRGDDLVIAPARGCVGVGFLQAAIHAGATMLTTDGAIAAELSARHRSADIRRVFTQLTPRDIAGRIEPAMRERCPAAAS